MNNEFIRTIIPRARMTLDTSRKRFMRFLLSFKGDINYGYGAALKYDRIDSYSILVLWWHYIALIALVIVNHFGRLAEMYPSALSWRVISLTESVVSIIIATVAFISPVYLRKRLKSHYRWRIALTLSLTLFSFLFIFVSGGAIEMHFHLFIVMAYIAVYSDWRLEYIILLAIFVHHVIIDLIAPGWLLVYGHNQLSLVAHAFPLFVTAIFTAYTCRNHRDVLVSQKELEQKKDEFISVASHELKTPITTIKGFTQIFQRKLITRNGDKKFIQYLSKMNEQLDRLTTLINDLLNVSKIRAGKLELSREEFDVDVFVKTVVSEIEEFAPTHTFSIKGKAKTVIRADKQRLTQVLTNLLSNAVKYAPESDNLVLHVFREHNNVIIGVQDEGPGIPPDKRLSIFEPFYQIDSTRRSSFSGLGLGLYISSEIMRRHGGDVWVESEVGKGSTFYISIPVKEHT